ncbi:reverse transcriptase domain-containing protein [Candidatus Thiodiazotropha sp. LNASS1]|uniref:reverse transcriptase domain-containing protein n=1 Tax=Candidatus Thiodiazotropha sp. LNASS1 TaxID=3096260 RepID=UPI0034DFB202
MGNRTLEQSFIAVFHNRESFDDFCSFDPKENVEEFLYKDRKVYRTSKKYKSYLRFLDKVILRHVARNADVVHSYIKGKSTLTAVGAHAGSSAFFLTDIKSFFPNITERDVTRVLTRDKAQIPIADFESYISYCSRIMTWDDSIPVGFPTSPQLSNGFLYEFDNALHDFCEKHGLIYTRYSDDIIISGDNKEKLLSLRDSVQELLHIYASDKLFINTEKTRITHIGNKVKILGLIITQEGNVTIDSKYKRTLETLLHFYTTDKARYNDFLEKKFDEKEHSLFGLLHYVKATDPTYLEKLQRKYGLLSLRILMEDKWSDKG